MKITDEKNLMLGKNSDIGSNFSFGYNVVIEDGAIIGNNVSIDHGSIIRRGVCIGDNTIIGANVILGEKTASRMIDSELPAMNLKIGSNSIIRSGSILYEGSTIGDNFQSGHNIVVREGTIIGHHSNLGDFVDYQDHVRIGNYVRCHSNDRLESFTILDDFAWIFPMVEFTNDRTPPSDNLKGVHVHSFALVCACSTVIAGLDIAEDCLIAAGSVVTHDVKKYQLVAGNPARVIADLRTVKNKFTGKNNYPWRKYFSNHMPWNEIGFDAWNELQLKKSSYVIETIPALTHGKNRSNMR